MIVENPAPRLLQGVSKIEPLKAGNNLQPTFYKDVHFLFCWPLKMLCFLQKLLNLMVNEER
jgi:hypothetical protein